MKTHVILIYLGSSLLIQLEIQLFEAVKVRCQMNISESESVLRMLIKNFGGTFVRVGGRERASHGWRAV